MPALDSRSGVMKSCLGCRKRFYCLPSELDLNRRDGVRKYCSYSCRYNDVVFKKNLQRRLAESWTVKRRKAWSKFMGSPVGQKQQEKAQRNGNQQRIGKPNLGAQSWWDSASEEDRKARSRKISKKLIAYISKNGAGWANRGFVKGKQGFLRTRFGVIRFDSGWEKEFLLSLVNNKAVISVIRDFPVRYTLTGSSHLFLVDFCVKFKQRKPILVEIKCPYFLDTKQTKAKVRAAKAYAQKHGMEFRIFASRKQVRGKLK